jgi:High potential iron-sulfur protein
LNKIARRKFIQLSAAAAAGCLANPSREALADDLPHLSADDPMGAAMHYTDDSSSVDPSMRSNPAPEQHCGNCALVQGNDGDAWRPCQIFPGKAVNANGWCSAWAPRS